jgi:LacI family transcriptional regulator
MRKSGNSAKHTEPATITEIASRAKVSIGTVDRVVHNRGRVAPETERRVRAVIRELGYKPNIYASHLSRAKTYHFGIIMPRRDQDSGFWESSVAGVEKAVSELHHYRVHIRYFYYDRFAPEQFRRVEKQVLTASPDGLLIAPVIHEPIRELVQKLPAGRPYVFVNTTIAELAPLSFIGQDSRQSGLVCGRLMRLLTGTQAVLAAVLPVAQDPHIRARADGFREAFADAPGVTIREYELADHNDPDITGPVLDRMLAGNPGLKGIFVANVAVHYVAAWLRKHGRVKRIRLIGYDLIPKNIAALTDGTIDFLISQKPRRQSYEGIYALYRAIALKEKIAEKIMMPIDIITKENVGFYDMS